MNTRNKQLPPVAEPPAKKSRISFASIFGPNKREKPGLQQKLLRAYFETKSHPLVTSKESDYQYYRAKPALERQTSFIIYTDKEKGFMEVYLPAKDLGGGCNGELRLFTSTTNALRHLAVKKRLHHNAKPEKRIDMWVQANEILQEAELMQQSNHDTNTVQVKHYIQNDRFDYRYIMPFFDGETFMTVANKMADIKELRLWILAIAEEVNRLHQSGIVHGDVNESNVVCTVTIDTMTGIKSYHARCVEEFHEMLEEREWFAPELFDSDEPVVTHTSLDVYGMGDLVGFGLNALKQSGNEESCALLAEFSRKALKINPEKRPSLTGFIEQLKAATESYNSVKGLRF